MTDQNPNDHKGGRWNAQEHDRFVKALSLYGKDWKKVERFCRYTFDTTSEIMSEDILSS